MLGLPRIAPVVYPSLMKLHLLDATYELFRAHFGYPSREDKDGAPIHAVAGLIESTLGLLRQDDVTHVGAAFDSVIRSFRNDLFDGYKTGEGIEPELMAQFPIAERALEAIGLKVWRMQEFEADDALAAAAMKFCDNVDQVVIMTPDKDLAQCVVGDRIIMYNRRERAERNEQGVWEKWGVGPESIPDYLALVGDTADGIPGIAAWGAKSSSIVLGRYGRLEQIPKDEGDWDVKVRGASRLGENLRSDFDDALLYRHLATLRRDAPTSDHIGELEWKGVHRQAFLALCDELGLADFKEKPHQWSDELPV